MNKTKKITIIASVIVGLVIVAGAQVIAKKREMSQAGVIIVQRSISKAELAKADGKNGHDCLVAIDATVYQIKDFSLWQNGEHTPSNGLAYCGADLSNVIDNAPHGRKILNILPKVGWLVG